MDLILQRVYENQKLENMKKKIDIGEDTRKLEI